LVVVRSILGVGRVAVAVRDCPNDVRERSDGRQDALSPLCAFNALRKLTDGAITARVNHAELLPHRVVREGGALIRRLIVAGRGV